jgi:hypothetical protein
MKVLAFFCAIALFILYLPVLWLEWGLNAFGRYLDRHYNRRWC